MAQVRGSSWRAPASAMVRRLLMGLMLGLVFGALATQAGAVQTRQFLHGSRSAAAPSGATDLCRTYSWACSISAAGRTVSSADLRRIEAVNRTINRNVRFLPDDRQFRVAESWSLPTERGGDCEDFVLLKKRELIRRGIPAQALLIATALDRKRRGHAVLILRTAGGDLVLDNQTDRIRGYSETGYTFLRMQNPASPDRWVNVVSAN